MRFFVKSAFICSFSLFLGICSAQINQDKKIVAEFSGNKITRHEFDDAFIKANGNNPEKGDTLAERRKFLDLYVNYKLKILDAYQKGLDKDPEIVNEYNNYRKSIGAGMLVDREFTSKGIKKLYERRKTELRLSQIFIKFDSSLADRGKSKAENLLSRINKGEKFEDLVVKYSDDPNAKITKGDLYYITSGDLGIPEIEDALYATDAGKVCNQVFKTQVGFHIIKVTEKQPKVFAYNVSHILVAFQNRQNPADTAAEFKKINEALNEIKSGVSFEDAAKKYSDDKSSAVKGGVLTASARGTFPKEFEEVAYKLKDNEISGIVKTQYGFHLIKMRGTLPYPSLAEQTDNLKGLYSASSYEQELNSYIEKLKIEFNYKLNFGLVDKIKSVKDSCNVGDSLFYFNVRMAYKDSVIAMLNNQPVIADSIFTYMFSAKEIVYHRFNSELLDMAITKYFTGVMLKEKAMLVLLGDPEFEKIMDDYKTGMILFKVSEDEIWTKVKVDTNKIMPYWESTKQNYIMNPKVTYKEIYLTTTNLRDTVWQLLKSGVVFDSLIKFSNRPESDKSKVKYVNDEILTQKANSLKNVGDYTEPFEYNGGWSIVHLEAREEKRIKTFEEAKPEVASALQEIETKNMEQQYIKKLRDNYKPKLYYENINN